MRNRNTDLMGALAAFLLACLIWAVPAQAERVRVGRADTLGGRSSVRVEPGDVQVEIKSAPDSLGSIVIHGRRHRGSEDSTDVVRVGEDITIEPGQEVEGDV